jgi:hypothetical protein
MAAAFGFREGVPEGAFGIRDLVRGPVGAGQSVCLPKPLVS